VTLTIGETLIQTRKTLRYSGGNETKLEADLLLCISLGMDRSRLYSSLEKTFSEAEQKNLSRLVQRRLLREPVAYLLEKKEFFGLDFQVGPGVFIPRPATESLVEQAIDMLQSESPKGHTIIADVGTGSGAVAISLAVHLPHSHLYATDISPSALAVARANAEAHGVQQQVTFLSGDLLSPLPEHVDMVVANLPYIRSSVIPCLEPEISRFEPTEALDGGADGLDLVRRLLNQGPDHLHSEATIFLELDPEQMDAASSAALAVYRGAWIYCINDLAGYQRVLVVHCNDAPTH